MDKRDEKTGRTGPVTDKTDGLDRLHGLDRSGLGDKGWAEVPADRIGGHPELETAPNPNNGGGLNGPQPETDLATGAVKPVKPVRPN